MTKEQFEIKEQFEKVAEEYENTQDYCGLLDVLFEEQYNQCYGQLSDYISPYIEQAFKDGAEFGYNKALEEQGDKIESAYREGVAFGKDKLKDEWHYVKDGDLPKEQQLVLLYRENLNGANVALAYWYKSYVNDKVIAWKEIVPPKEVK